MKKKRDYVTLYMTNRTIVERINTNVEFRSVMALRGYGDAQFAEGNRLVEAVQQAAHSQTMAEGECAGSYDSFAKAWKRVEQAYREIRRLSKVVCEDSPEHMQRLGLNGTVPQTWIPQSAVIEQFCRAVFADTSVLEPLRRLNIDEPMVRDLEKQLDEAKVARNLYIQRRSERGTRVAEKVAAIQELDAWVRLMVRVARVATKGTLLLSSIGVDQKVADVREEIKQMESLQ